MTFQNLSPFVVSGLIASLAGILFLLHLLRIKPREVEVPTVLFWREAIEERRRRRLGGRFRHPRTFAMLVLLAGLLALALAEPETGASKDARASLVIVVDRGASARTGPGMLDLDGVSLDAEVAVLLAGARPRVGAAFGAPRPAARCALADHGPDGGPADWRSAMRMASALLEGRSQPRVRIYVSRLGEIEPADLALLGDIPHDVVARGGDFEDSGITAVSAEADGLWVRLDGRLGPLTQLAVPGASQERVDVRSDDLESRWISLGRGMAATRTAGPWRVIRTPEDSSGVNDTLIFLPATGSDVGSVFCRGLHADTARLLVAADPALSEVSEESDADVIVEIAPGNGQPVPRGTPVSIAGEVSLFPEDLAASPMLVPEGIVALEGDVDDRTLVRAGSLALARAKRGEQATIACVPWMLDPLSAFIRSARGARALARILRQGAGVRPASRAVAAGRTWEVRLAGGEDAMARADDAGFVHALDEKGFARVCLAGTRNLFDLGHAPALSGYVEPPSAAPAERADAPGPLEIAGGLRLWEFLALLAFLVLLIDAWLHLQGRIP